MTAMKMRMVRMKERRIKVVLGTTMVVDLSAWETHPQSSLPYIETSSASPDGYESVLLDEDIIVGLKVRVVLL